MRYATLLGILWSGLRMTTALAAATEVSITMEAAHTRTAIDAQSSAVINFAVRSQAPTITAVQVTLPLTRGPETSLPLVFALWDRLDGPQTSGAAVLSRVEKRAVDIDADGARRFSITLYPRGLAPGNYSISMTTSAPRGQGYVLAGGRVCAEPAAFLDTTPVKTVPEPLSLVSTVAGVVLVGLYGLRQRGRFARLRAA